MAMAYMDGSTRAFKWNVGHVFPRQSPCPLEECIPAAGIIIIRYTTFPGGARKVVPVPYCLHQLYSFQDFNRTVKFLHQTLQTLSVLGSCKNLLKCARILATDLAGRFHFNPESFNRKIERHRLVIYLQLRVETTNSSKNLKQWVVKLESAKQIERYLQTKCPEINTVGESKGMEEVKALFEITEVDDDEDETNEATCPICLEEMYEKSARVDVARVCNCSHVFHAHCIGRWLRDKHSCPMCRSFSDISIQRSTIDFHNS